MQALSLESHPLQTMHPNESVMCAVIEKYLGIPYQRDPEPPYSYECSTLAEASRAEFGLETPYIAQILQGNVEALMEVGSNEIQVKWDIVQSEPWNTDLVICPYTKGGAPVHCGVLLSSGVLHAFAPLNGHGSVHWTPLNSFKVFFRHIEFWRARLL